MEHEQCMFDSENKSLIIIYKFNCLKIVVRKTVGLNKIFSLYILSQKWNYTKRIS